MKSALTAVLAWTFAAALMVLIFAVGLALTVPLLATAWDRLDGRHASLLVWLVSGALAMLGLGIIEWASGQVGPMIRELIRGPEKAAGAPIAH